MLIPSGHKKVGGNFQTMQGSSSVFDFLSLQFSPSNKPVAGCFSSLASAMSLGFKKLGWLVEESSLAHILSVITTLFCFSVIRCELPSEKINSVKKVFKY